MHIVPWMLQNVPTFRLKRLIWSLSRRRKFNFVTRTHRGWVVRGNTTDWIQRTLFYFGVWEPNLSRWLEQRLAAGDVFIDVGANVGYFTLLAADCVGESGRVVAIEPMPEIYELLAHHVAVNALRNVRAINEAALGPGKVGTVTLYRGEEENLGSTSLLQRCPHSGTARVTGRPLAAMLTDEECRRARIIKIDVEGAEADAILGLELESGRFRDDLELIVEISFDTPSAQAQREKLSKYLADLRFNAYLLPEIVTFRESIHKYAQRLVPVRVRGELPKSNNFIFSRVDSATLEPTYGAAMDARG